MKIFIKTPIACSSSNESTKLLKKLFKRRKKSILDLEINKPIPLHDNTTVIVFLPQNGSPRKDYLEYIEFLNSFNLSLIVFAKHERDIPIFLEELPTIIYKNKNLKELLQRIIY